MKRIIQSCLLKSYALVVKTGILSTSWGRSIFLTTYNWYKVLIEAGEVKSLQSYIKPGEVAIDIGANVGFFTTRFAKWVSDGGFVIAVEPETANFEQLLKNLNKNRTTELVKTFQGVAAEEAGTLKLAINPIHPADHKIGQEGIEVQAFTIDDLVKEESAERVCLIKIDVQGAEERVLLGAKETIQRDHPALFVEMDDVAMKKMGSSAEKVINLLTGYAYQIQCLGKNSQTTTISAEQALELCCDGKYVDLLFTKNTN
jgi:FkbM family methyltransferase